MQKPEIAGLQPVSIQVEKGKSYFWCSCGRSANQPFCDGSHKPTGFSPLKFVAEKDELLWFCACKQSQNRPLCDGSHNRLNKT